MRSTLLIASLVALQIQQVQITPQRDQPPPQQQMPTVRMVPVGTSSIGGTVTAADTGRPIRGARVQVNGTIASALSRGRGPAPGGSSAPLPAGVSAGPGVASAPVNTSPGRAVGPGSSAPGPVYMNNASRSAMTDDLGNYLIEKLPAGQYQITISAPRNTYLQASYGQKKFGGTPGFFQLGDGQRAKVNMALVRGGVITGTVFSEDGEPQGNTQVQAHRYSMSGGVKRLQQTGYAQTDDRGVYRMFGLQPGDYIVAATPDSNLLTQYAYSNPDDALIEQAIASGAINPPREPGMPSTVAIPIRTPQEQQEMSQRRQLEGPPPGYLPVYHPGTPVRTGATIVRIDGGDERTSIDVHLRLIQSTNIIGTIQNPPGEGLAVQVSLLNDDPVQQNFNGARADRYNNWRFALRNVQPGKYTLLAQIVPAPTSTTVNGVTTTISRNSELDESQRWWGRAVVEVEGQPGITQDITLKPPRTISGRVVFEMERIPDLTRQKIAVNLSQAPGSQSGYYMNPLPAELAPDGTFTLKGVIPGKYTLRAQVGIAKSVMVNGQDLLDFPLDFTGDRNVTDAVITVTDKSSEVSGTLIDTTGRPAVDYAVVAAAADERFWTPASRRVVLSRPSPQGVYTLRNLPPGEYLLAAVSDLESGGQYDPEFLKSLASAAAMRILVVEGGKITQDLRVAR